MEASLADLIDFVEPGCSSTIPDLSSLHLETKYIPALEPNPQLIRLFYRHVSNPQVKPTASIVIAHGFGENSVKYMEAAARLALAGFDVHVLDQRTSGHSGGCRPGHDLYELVKDVNKLVQQVKPDIPCFLWGHSMGGLLCTYLLELNPLFRVSGAIITSAAYRLVNDLSPGLKRFVSLSAPTSTELMLAIQLPLSGISRNDVFTRALFQDKTNNPLASFPYVASVGEVQKYVLANASKLRCPMLFMHGDKDVLTAIRGTEEVYQQCGSADKTLKVYPGGYHELHHDLDKDQFFTEVIEWLRGKVPTARVIGSVGRLRSVPDQQSSRRNWKLWVLVLAGIYVLGLLWFRTKNSAAAVKWLVYTAVPKLFWPIYLPLSLLQGKGK